MGPRDHHSERFKGVIFLLLTLAGWSSSPLFLKYFVGMMDAWTSNGWRYSVAALFWLPRLVAAGGSERETAGIWRAAVWPALFNASGQIAFAWVLYLQIDPGMMTFLLRSQIVFVTIGAFTLFRDERVIARLPGYWLGLALVVAGTIGTIFLGAQRPSGASAAGVVLGIASGALFGCYALAVRAKMSRYSPMSAFAVISLYTAAILVVLMLVLGEHHGAAPLQLTPGGAAVLVVSALAGIALGHVFYYASISRLGVAAASSILLLQPFITAVFSRLFFAERLTGMQWVAGSISVLGAGVIIENQRRLPSLRAGRAPAVAVVAPVSDGSGAMAARSS